MLGGQMRLSNLKVITFSVVVLLLFSLSAPMAQKEIKKQPKGSHNKSVGKRTIPAQTDKGSFVGTWYYIDRNQQFAIFIMQKGKKHKIKIQWKMNTREEFETDWEGECQYKFEGFDGEVRLKVLNPNDINSLKGEWEWSYDMGDMKRTEKSSFTMYRAEDGRKLVWMLPDFKRIIQRGDQSRTYAYENMHILRKSSDRIVDWEDITF